MVHETQAERLFNHARERGFVCPRDLDPVEGIRRIEVKGRRRGQPIRLATNEWYRATQLGDSYWLYVFLDPLDGPSPEPLRIRNPAKHLDHAKKEVIAARYYYIPAQAVEQAANQ